MIRRRGFGLFLLAALLPLLPHVAHGQGPIAAQSQNIVPNSRAQGMGRAFTAVAEGPYGIWWNPGGLTLPQPISGAVSATKLVPDFADDVWEGFAGCTYRGDAYGVGAYLAYLSYGESIATDEQGREIGRFDSWETTAMLGGALDLSQLGFPEIEGVHLGAGMSLKHFHVDLAPREFTLDGQVATGNAWDVDLGVLATIRRPLDLASESPAEHPSFVGIRAGAVLRNALHNRISFADEDPSDPLGRWDRWGVALEGSGFYSPEFGNQIQCLVTADVNGLLVKEYSDERPITNFGAELRLCNFLSARGGYINDVDGDITDWTIGGGIELNPEVDLFSYLPFGLRLDLARVPEATGLRPVWSASLGVWLVRT